MKNKLKKFQVTVIVEHMYVKDIRAKNAEEAERKALIWNIQDDEANYSGLEVMEPIVEELDKDGNIL